MAKDKQAKKAIKPSKADKGKGPAPIPAAAQPAATLSLVKQVDPELDDIFAKSASFALPPPKPASPTAAPTAGSSSRKRKLPDQPESSNKAARRATSEPMVADGSDDGDDDEGEELDNDADLSELDEDEAGLLDALEDEDGMPSELGEDPDEDERDSEDETPKTVTAAEGAKAPSATKKGKDKPRKYTPPGETREQKDARTVFVGNVPVEAVKNKALQKQLSRLIAALAPTSKVESMRFRSVAFAAPTAPEDDEDKEKKLSRERERAAAWKREHAAEAASASSRSKPKIADSEVEQSKTFFRPGERRRVAFIKKDLHPDVEVANAYIVFAHPAPDRSANVAPMMDPTEAAAQVVRQAHETPVIFEGRTLRIDAVRATLATIASTAAESGTSTLPLKRRVWTAGKDPKMSLYVGNLVYAAKEDDLRAFVESLVVGEKGPAPEGGAWVEDVRIIRDRDTQMGKGFAYVAMRSRECVDELLAMPTDKLSFAKRPLRLQACKTLPPALGGRAEAVKKAAAASGPAPKKASSSSTSSATTKKIRVVPAAIPKGDPRLGERLAALPKDERKAVKSSLEDRVARRQAKKAAKVAAAKVERGKVKLDVKGAAKKGKGGGHATKAKKGRVRSENAAKKVKGKRD